MARVLIESQHKKKTHMDGMGWAVQGQPLPHRLWVAHGQPSLLEGRKYLLYGKRVGWVGAGRLGLAGGCWAIEAGLGMI